MMCHIICKMLVVMLLLGAVAKEVFSVNLTKYTQKDYVVSSERFMEVSHNDEYVGSLNVKSFKYNRTSFAVNYTLHAKKDLHSDFLVDVQAYKFASNEYRLFPMSFPYNVCQALDRDTFGIRNMYKCGNPYRCPIKKGTYHICNWLPDSTKFPPYCPRGRYMVLMVGKYLKTELFRFQWYFGVSDVPPEY